MTYFMTLVGNETCIETAYFSLNIIITLTKLCLGPKLWYCQGPYVFLFDKLCFGPELWYRPGPYYHVDRDASLFRR